MNDYKNIGLKNSEVKERLLKYGPNSVKMERKAPPFLVFLKTLYNPLILLLLACSAVSAFLGDIKSLVTISIMVLLSSFLDFYNTYKSDKAAQKLKDQIKITTIAIRNETEQEIRVENIVPGDVIKLSVGDIVPADGVVLEPHHCFTNEAPLTGESFPIAKKKNDELLMGSSISTGECLMSVIKTGKETKFNHVISNLSKAETPTEFDHEISKFSILILKTTILLAIFVFIVNSILHGNYLNSLLFAVALAVGMAPEMMPMIIAINLTKGSLAMAKKGVIVKKLSAIQNFGSMDILCTDKTGTLTEDSIALVKYVDAQGNKSKDVLKFAYINSFLSNGFRNPLDKAIIKFEKLSIDGYRKIDEIPFDFTRRREAIIVKSQDKHIIISKGAPEEVFKCCKHHIAKGKSLDQETIQTAHQTYEKLSRGGFRVLAIAYGEVAEKAAYSTSDEKDLIFLGFLAFLDPPKTTVVNTIKKMTDYGVKIKIITGDNELVSQRIAQEINFPITGILLGSEIDKLTDDQLNQRAHNVNLFAKVNPDQKLRIIQTIQNHGHVVGYIGDGINDSPSLKAADVGISVNNATDIAKESADLIMMRKELDDLVLAVIEGRKTFVNTMKYLMMNSSSNFGNMFSMAGASAILPFLPMLPTQLLFNNLLYDTSQFTIPADNVDINDLKTPKRMSISVVKKFMVIMGPISSIFDFLTFYTLFFVLGLGQSQFQTGWFMESLATQVFIVYFIRTKAIPFLQSSPSKYLIAGTTFSVLVGWIVAMSKFGSFFGFTPLPYSIIITIILIVLCYVILGEIVKQFFYRKIISSEELKNI